MVESQVVSVTPALHSNNHRHGGSDPLTGDVRINSLVDGEGTVVFNDTSVAGWTDLDISAVVGARCVFAILSVHNSDGASNNFAVTRQKGSTDDIDITAENTRSAINLAIMRPGDDSELACYTDSDGILQIKYHDTLATIVKVIYYIL